MQMKSVKKQTLRVLAFIMALCLITVSFAGCGKEPINNPYMSAKQSLIESKVLSSKSQYKLEWDKDGRAVVYTNTETGTIWSDILYEDFKMYGDLESVNANGASPIFISVANNKTLKIEEDISSFSQMGKNGSIVCQSIKDGIRVIYFFERYRIAVPVEYVLKNDHLTISVDSSAILEDNDEFKLVSVSLVPNLCGVRNDAENGSILVPTGTGAIIPTAETPEGMQKYTTRIYGRDIAARVPMSLKDDIDSRMPVFGAYGSGKGLFGIIEEGAGAAYLTSKTGNVNSGYSNIYPTFYVRGYDTFMKEYYGQNIFGTESRYNDYISGQKFSVSYYPLEGEDADYNGMAKVYRNYLTSKGMIKKTNAKSSPYSVTFLGGTNVTKSFFGIPYQKVEALTTFNQAQKILEDLQKKSNVFPEVRLLGYGDRGLREGQIAGGSKYLSEYGKKKDLKALIDYCDKTNLFLDFDIVTYAESGNGFSVTGDVAKTAVKYKAVLYHTSPTRVNDEANEYYALARDQLTKSSEKALKKADKYSAKAVSLSTLGMYAYSDYDNDEYINRYLMEQDATEIIASAKKAGYTTAVAGANAYAACAADVVFDVLATSGDYDVFGYDVPFYQLVFGSYKSLYSEGVNLASNVEKEIALSVAYGMGISYYLTDAYVSDSDDLDEYKLYATVYEDNADRIKKVLVDDGFIEQYNKVAGSGLVNYELDGALAKSTFGNGVVIYTNLSDAEIESPVGTLGSYEYKIG